LVALGKWFGIVSAIKAEDLKKQFGELVAVDSVSFTVEAGEVFGFLELREKRDTLIEQLSGGMKRRLILARALINMPRLLILDEPTIGLDPQARHLIWDKLKSLQSQGITIVLTTHYLKEAARLCDRLVIMDYGKIIVEGTPDELIKEYAETRSATLEEVFLKLTGKKLRE